MRLDQYDNSGFDRGRSRWIEVCWIVVQGLFFSSWLPGSAWRTGLLRLFGAKIGKGSVIKPHVRIKFPWKLVVGDHAWLGEGVWIDNLAKVTIGNNCCLSQGAYLCTGSHRWDKNSFDLVTKPILIKDKAWIGAKATIAPGIKVYEGAVLSLSSVALTDLEMWTVYKGVPARPSTSRPMSE